MTSKTTIRTIKARLAAVFPEVNFTYGTGGRGRMRGHAVSWIGGPSAGEVSAARGAPMGWHNPLQHFHRIMTDAERAVWIAEMDAQDAARRAEEPARRAAAKAAGIAKARATREHRAAMLAKIKARWPLTAFTLDDGRPTWTDGPSVSDVAAELGAMGITQYHCTRRETPQGKAAAANMTRLARRLARSKARPVMLALGIARRRQARAAVAARARDKARQMWLPLTPFLIDAAQSNALLLLTD
jgi:hypothetical protein